MKPNRLRRASIRWLLGCGALGVAATARSQPTTVEVWVDLAPPPAGTGIAAQQDAVVAQLQRLGAVELGRMRHSGNAVAVRIDPARLDEVRAIEGVRRIRSAVKRHPPRTMG
jgi:hypothetical protein